MDKNTLECDNNKTNLRLKKQICFFKQSLEDLITLYNNYNMNRNKMEYYTVTQNEPA